MYNKLSFLKFSLGLTVPDDELYLLDVHDRSADERRSLSTLFLFQDLRRFQPLNDCAGNKANFYFISLNGGSFACCGRGERLRLEALSLNIGPATLMPDDRHSHNIGPFILSFLSLTFVELSLNFKMAQNSLRFLEFLESQTLGNAALLQRHIEQ